MINNNILSNIVESFITRQKPTKREVFHDFTVTIVNCTSKPHDFLLSANYTTLRLRKFLLFTKWHSTLIFIDRIGRRSTWDTIKNNLQSIACVKVHNYIIFEVFFVRCAFLCACCLIKTGRKSVKHKFN